MAEPRRADAAPACGIFVRGNAHVELRLRVSPPFVHAHLVQPAAPDLRSDGATDVQRLREEHPLPLLGALLGVLDAVLVALDHVDQLAVRHHQHRPGKRLPPGSARSEEHTSELQSLMRISYAVFCLKKKTKTIKTCTKQPHHTTR